MTTRRLWLGAGLIAVGLLVVMVARAAIVTSTITAAEPAPVALPAVEPGQAAARLGSAIRFVTVSRDEPPDAADTGAFRGLHQMLAESFPRVHATMTRETVGEASLMYTWRGTHDAAAPIVLLAHLDVVPADDASRWQHPPFAGRIADGQVWGRGALDNKAGVIGILDAAEHLLRAGHRPRATIYLAFGHDEEVGGVRGAAALAKLLAERNVEPAFVLDEGAAVFDGVIPGIGVPIATVAVAEKGHVSVELSVEQPGGHSSLPPASTTVGVLSEAIRRLEQNQLPARLGVPSRATIDSFSAHMPFGYRLVLANLWLFEPLVTWGLAGTAETSPMVRTTTAATMFNAGSKRNVLPSEARAVVDFRILPGDTIQSVLDHVGRTIADERINIRLLEPARDPPPISPHDNQQFRLLTAAIRDVFGDIPIAPTLCYGGTDARHYAELTDRVFRFAPFVADKDVAARLHGVDERIGVADYARVIRFYMALMTRAAGSGSD